jgi:hypothetical protein
MRQGVPRASLDADQLRYTAEQKAIKECKCIFLYPECTVNPEESLYPERLHSVFLQSSPPLRKRYVKKLRQAKVPWGSKKAADGER